MNYGFQARNASLRSDEIRQIRQQKGLSYAEKVQCYELQASDTKALHAMKSNHAWRALDSVWKIKQYVRPAAVGSIFGHLRATCPSERSEWLDLYFEKYPYASFMALAERIVYEAQTPKGMSAEFLTPQFVLDGLTIRVIENSWTGYEAEMMGYNLCLDRIAKGENIGYDGVRFTTEKEDRDFAIDIVLMLQGVPVIGLQVKPQSYLTNRDKLDTKLNNKGFNLAWQKLTGAKVYYLNSTDIRKGDLRPISLSELDRRFGF